MSIRKNAKRITATLDNDVLAEVDLLAKKRQMTRSEWLNWAIDQAISQEHGQYGIAGLTAQRLNQFQNSIVEMSKSQDNLSELIIQLVKMMNTLISGNSYLNDEDVE